MAAPSPSKLAHVVLRTSRFDEVVEWWCNVLQARRVHETDFLTFLTYDDEHHRLAILRAADADDQSDAHAGLAHVAFTYESLDDLVTTYERLRDQGIRPVFPVNHGMTLSLYYAAPDGVQCELQVDLCAADDALSFMQSPDFASNPIGVTFDPELLAAQHRAGQRPDALTVWGPLAGT